MTWIELLHKQPWLFYLGASLLGLVVGSFLNVVIVRLPRMLEQEWHEQCVELLASQAESDAAPETPAQPRLSLSHPPSHCPHCARSIRAHENIPVLSYVLLRGRCAGCGERISLRYPLIEVMSALLTLAVAAHFGPSWEGLAAGLLTWSLLALAVIDYDTQLLPDRITLPLLWLGLVLSLGGFFTEPQAAILGAAIGYLSLWSIFQLFRLLTGKEGMGYGDFKLLALFGAWFGWQALPQIMLLSAFTGALLGVTLIASGVHKRGDPLPFGPFLAAAGWLSLLWGDEINRAYLQFSGLG